MSGATFSVSNLGTYGIREFSAIINPPEVGILAVAAAEKRAVVRDERDRRPHHDDRNPLRRPPRRRWRRRRRVPPHPQELPGRPGNDAHLRAAVRQSSPLHSQLNLSGTRLPPFAPLVPQSLAHLTFPALPLHFPPLYAPAGLSCQTLAPPPAYSRYASATRSYREDRANLVARADRVPAWVSMSRPCSGRTIV